MKVKELIKQLQELNPNAEVVLGSDSELNNIYETIEVSISKYEDDLIYTNVDLTPENVAKIKEVVIWGY